MDYGGHKTLKYYTQIRIHSVLMCEFTLSVNLRKQWNKYALKNRSKLLTFLRLSRWHSGNICYCCA